MFNDEPESVDILDTTTTVSTKYIKVGDFICSFSSTEHPCDKYTDQPQTILDIHLLDIKILIFFNKSIAVVLTYKKISSLGENC